MKRFLLNLISIPGIYLIYAVTCKNIPPQICDWGWSGPICVCAQPGTSLFFIAKIYRAQKVLNGQWLFQSWSCFACFEYILQVAFWLVDIQSFPIFEQEFHSWTKCVKTSKNVYVSACLMFLCADSDYPTRYASGSFHSVDKTKKHFVRWYRKHPSALEQADRGICFPHTPQIYLYSMAWCLWENLRKTEIHLIHLKDDEERSKFDCGNQQEIANLNVKHL